MTPQQRIENFAQSVYLATHNRYFDDIAGEDGQTYINQIIDFTNQYLDELEGETDTDNQPMNWSFMREFDYPLGSVASATSQSFDLDDDVLRLVTDETRPLVLLSDAAIISTFEVVDPNQITRSNRSTQDRATIIKRRLVFSRAFKDYEVGATINADVITSLPRLTASDASLFDVVKPHQLLILGVAKNSTLPDIVQGGLSPSYVQRYSELLTQAKAQNDASSVSDLMVREDLSHIGGIY